MVSLKTVIKIIVNGFCFLTLIIIDKSYSMVNLGISQNLIYPVFVVSKSEAHTGVT